MVYPFAGKMNRTITKTEQSNKQFNVLSPSGNASIANSLPSGYTPLHRSHFF